MKITILACVLGLCGASALAQGTVNFANAAAGGPNAPIRCNTSIWGAIELCSGPDWVADLWYGPAGTQGSGLTPLNQPATFLTGAQAGYFTGGARTIPGIPGGSSAVFQVRVWNRQAGATWEEAMASGLLFGMGWSELFNVTPTVPPSTPANLTGLHSFDAILIPEPTSFALVGLGAATLTILRRRT